MDPARTPLGRMLLDEITPVVMVLRTPLVEEACGKNGLSFVEMLSPFCSFSNIDVPVRTASDQPYRLQKFKLRLFYSSDIRQPDVQVANERLKDVITQAGEKDLSNLSSELPQVDELLSSSESDIMPSWFQFFNKELIRTMSFSDHEAFDHPVACLLVVSSKDEQPINRFVDLFNSDQLPSLLNDGAMDPKILKLYLIVHDNQDGAPEKAKKFHNEMRSTFGSNSSQLLCINSSQGGLVEHLQNPWAPFKTDASPTQRLGGFLNIDDFNEIKKLTQDLASKHVIPYMEEKVRVLNQQVSATRKGFKNQIKNLWWRKGKEDTPDASNGPVYTFSSIESQIRVLGDYAFMLRDYELALSNYRLISTDYKLDKAWKRYAGVQEMMGLTFFMLDQSRKEAEYCMENAFNTYLKTGPTGQQNATRSGLWWVEMLKTRDQFKEAAGVYFRISGEEPLHSAVMLEQASYCYLLSKPPMLRKFGFHLILSGNQYKKSDQIKHAIRTYRRSISVLKGTTWSYIQDHVHFHIGQWYSFLGLYDSAVSHLLEVLSCGHQSKTTQEFFLKIFLQTVQKTGKACQVMRLPLPVINSSSLKVVFEDHRTYASPAATGVRESLWQSLEEEIVPSLPAARANWLEVQSNFTSKPNKNSNMCIVGEAIKVAIEFQNPLQISIPLSDVSLMCELCARSDDADSEANSLTAELQNDEATMLTTDRFLNSDMSSFALSNVELTLEGGGRKMVQLTVTPRVEGTLKIVGVKWKFSSSVVGFHNFVTGSVKKIQKGGKKNKQSPADSLKFDVVKTVPRLEGFIQSLPEKVYAGELQQLTLELNNKSHLSVKNLKMKISHPRYLNIGNQRNLNMDYPACLEKKTNSAEKTILEPHTINAPRNVFLFPEDTVVQGDTSFLWPLWLHAAAPGKVSLYIILYYEIENPESFMKYRTLRMLYNLEIFPSLDVSFQISACPSTLEEFLVRMDIANKTSTRNFQIHQLSSIGYQWEISLLQPTDSIYASPTLMSGQAFSCYLILKKSKRLDRAEANGSPVCSLTVSDIQLSTEGAGGKMYDSSLSPVKDFHNVERLQHGKSLEGDSNMVDFVLIYWPLDSETDPGVSDRPSLFSHHECHCSVASTSPISWVVEGPRLIHHDFSTSFCEVTLKMALYNSADAAASVRINTLDLSRNGDAQSRDESTLASGKQAGWYNVSLDSEIKVTSDVSGIQMKPLSSDSASPFVWTGSSSTKVRLPPLSTLGIPLQICVFSPGTYDLSNYILQWSLVLPDDQGNHGETRPSSGTCQGYSYFLTVLQST
ncbi:trafficking protein particle complex subunit 8 [Rhodamnia argentea]|uniref:Trafficking protein particle complex subunit 8 n=1 Tax=Rhodamnia argentea TaxID=178133 RepID=A0ABM3GRD5_9MYRT|nr:trafficking protein particle complex subunit 8 [Rhodamnia argentea]